MSDTMENLGVTMAPGLDTALVNFYKILNVDMGASPKEIRDAYMRLKSAYSADSQALYSIMSDDEAKHNLALIDEAYRILEDDKSREQFNVRLRDFESNQGFAGNRRPHAPTHLLESALGGADEALEGAFDPSLPHSPEGFSGGRPLIRTVASNAGNAKVQDVISQLLTEADNSDGDLLRRIREACGVSIEEIQERTKILADYIRGIEENRFDRLPPAVYVKGFIRSYLKYLAVPDPERFAKAYGARIEEWRLSARN